MYLQSDLASLKKIVTISLVLLVTALILGAAAYFMAKKYEPEVRDIIVYEVNRLLDVEVSVDDINLSLLQRFPYASLRFSHVMIPEGYSEGPLDTLLYAEDVYLQISLWDFLRKQYRVSEAEVNNGFFRMAIYEDGKDNYHFWKASEKADASVLSLNDIETNNLRFSLRYKEELELEVDIHHAHSAGNFGGEKYDVSSGVHLDLARLVMKGDTLYQGLPVDGNFTLAINHESNRHELTSEALRLGQEKVKVSGQYDPRHKNAWQVSATADGARIEHIVALLPQSIQSSFRVYKARGKSDMVFEASGADDAALSMDLLFDRTNGSFQHDVALGKAKIDKGAGSLQVRGDVVSLYVDHLRGSLGPGKLKISGSIRNFKAPDFNLAVDGNVDLREVRNFFDLDDLDEMKGKVTLAGIFTGKLPAGKESENLALLKGIDFDGHILVEGGALRPRNATTYFEKINGEIEIRENAFIVQNAAALANGNAFSFSGKMINALPYLTSDGQKLHIEADFTAPHIDLNKIWDASATSRDTTYQFSLPELVTFDFRLEVGKLEFRRFVATELAGRASYNNALLLLNPISFRTADGHARGSASVRKATPARYEVKSGLHLQQIDIGALFYAFENFSQSVVKSEQLSGVADARVTFDAPLRQDLSFDLDRLAAKVDLEVVNGALKNVESLTEIANYLRGNLVWRSLVRVEAFEKELKEVRFDTLRNSIVIHDRVVHIPSMRVGSSALTLNLSGDHSFENQIDYRINFRLSELFKTGKTQEDEFGYIEDDGTGLRLFLRMNGHADNPQFSMDREGARQKRIDEFEKEKDTFKGMLKEEFGLFKSDTTLAAPPQKSDAKKPVFEVEWHDGKAPEEENKAKRKGIFSPKEKEDVPVDEDDDL